MSSIAIRRVLVAIKYPFAETPLSVLKAAQLARGLHAELALFHAIDQPLCAEDCPGEGSKSSEDQRHIREHFLRDLAAQATALKADGLPVTVSAEWDHPAHEAVLRQAHRIGADLIVTERHPPVALRSSDWELLRLSSKPVLIVKDDGEERLYRQPVIVAAVDPLHRHSRSAGLDEEICKLARSFSTGLGGLWVALHAYAADPFGLVQPRRGAGAPGPGRTRALAAVNHMLQSVELRPQAVQLVDSDPAKAIIQSTRELHASLLVIGALSRNGLKRILIGNTAEQVIDRVACDVLVVKPQHFGTRFSRETRGARRLPNSRSPVP